MKFDDILSKLGEFGAYQKRLYLLLCIPAISVGSFMMMLIVVMETPEHRCKIPGYENDTYAVQGHYHQSLINSSIPETTDSTKKYDQCHVYLYQGNETENRSLTECTEWVYEQTMFTETFTSKVNLVCKDALKTSHAMMIFYFGVLSGDFIFGVIADWIGRKKSLYIALIILIASSFAVAWIPNYVGFVILQFIIGGASHGAFVVCCVLGLELVGPSKRVWVGMVIQGFFATGLVYLAGMGYFVKQWQYIDLAVAIPCVFYLVYWWLIPESPRWLISQGRRFEANNIIRKAAKVNKVVLPENLIDSKTSEKSPEGQIWHLFTSKVLFVRTMILFYNWMVVSLMYYGVTMNSGNIGGNFYLNFFLFACMEYPAYAIAIFFLDKVGRKKLHCACMITGGAACLSTIFTVLFGGESLYPLTLTLALIGKLGAAAAFGIIYVFSAELFPTVVRNAGMGTSSCVARIGGMLAPYIAKSGSLVGGKFGKALPLVIFGAFSISAGLLCLLLPETLNQNLPDTIEEGRRFGRTKKHPKDNELYIAAEIDECKIPGFENDTYVVQGHYHQSLINVTIPESTDLTKNYDQCHIYSYDDNYNDTEYTYRKQSLTECTEWVYEQTEFTETFTSQVNLVCKDALKTSHAMMIFYFGVLLGDFVFGVIADRFGRKKSFCIALVILIASSFAVAWVTNYIGFVILQFIIGGASHGAFVVCCVLGFELVGTSKRVLINFMIQGFFAVGLVYLAGIGYFVKQWQYIDIAVAIPCVFYLVYWWLVPESPRWLIIQGRPKEANNIIKKAAKVNKVVLPENLIDSKTTENPPEGQIWDLFTSKVLFVRTMVLFYNWMVVSLMYFGVTMNSGNIGGNFFLNFFLFGITDIPAFAIAVFLLDKVGRKKLHCACMITGGVACLSTIFAVLFGGESLYPVTLTLALIGKLGSAAAFGTIYVFSAELFPTVVRNAGIGTSSCVARIGGMLAPYIAKSGSLVGGRFGKALPLVIFGAFSISAGLLCLLLPETLHQKLPDTLEDGRRFGRKKKHPKDIELHIDAVDDESRRGNL